MLLYNSVIFNFLKIKHQVATELVIGDLLNLNNLVGYNNQSSYDIPYYIYNIKSLACFS